MRIKVAVHAYTHAHKLHAYNDDGGVVLGWPVCVKGQLTVQPN
jgi:hypothetical protein